MPPSAAIDGVPSSRWSSGRPQSNNNDWLKVDFGGVVKITSLTINNSSDGAGGDFAVTYSIFGSMDGVTFGSNAFSIGRAPGTPTYTISFAQQILRAVKIMETSVNYGNSFSIGEVTAACL